MILDSVGRFEARANLRTNFEPLRHMEKTFLNAAQLCEYLNLKPSTVYLKVATGDLPHYRIGRLIRFRKEEIDAWMERHLGKSDANKESKTIRGGIKTATVDVNRIVEKTIDDVMGKRYTPISGKPDQVFKGLETKEV
jgi:excisionase family DNA binding protein